MNWSSLTATSDFSNQFCDLIFQLNLSQLIDVPTHVQGNTLDLVLTNSEHLIVSLSVDNKTSTHLNSDHHKVSFNIDTSISCPAKNPTIYIFDYPKGDYHNLCNTLLQVNFTPCLFSQDTEFVWNLIKSEIRSKSHAPAYTYNKITLRSVSQMVHTFYSSSGKMYAHSQEEMQPVSYSSQSLQARKPSTMKYHS